MYPKKVLYSPSAQLGSCPEMPDSTIAAGTDTKMVLLDGLNASLLLFSEVAAARSTTERLFVGAGTWGGMI